MKQVELNRLVSAALKKDAKARGWKSISGQSYWRNDHLFFQLLFSTAARERDCACYLRVKWYSLDDQLWKVLGMTSNSLRPMSLRANGAYTIFGHDVLSVRTMECEWSPGWLEQRLAAISQSAEVKAVELVAAIRTIDDYLAFIKRDYEALLARVPNTAYNVWQESLLIALEKGDYATVRQIATARSESADAGGFIVGGQTLYQRALEYIKR